MCRHTERERERAFTSSSHSRLQSFWFTSQRCRPRLFWQREISEYLRYVFNIWMLRPQAVWNPNQFNHWEKCRTAGCLVRHSGGKSLNQKIISHWIVRTPTRWDQSRKSVGFRNTLILVKVTLWKFRKVLPRSGPWKFFLKKSHLDSKPWSPVIRERHHSLWC